MTITGSFFNRVVGHRPVLFILKMNETLPKHFFEQTFYMNVTRSQLAITCSKLTIETVEQGAKYVQS